MRDETKARLRPIAMWATIAFFLLLGGAWAYRKGMDMRHDVWIGSRSIRFLGDISNGYKYGGRTIRLAEDIAGLPEYSDALANQPPDVLAKSRDELPGDTKAPLRRLTSRELFYGLVRFYDLPDNDEDDGDKGNYRLDYLPARLAVMTLWTRHAQRVDPSAIRYPKTETRADSPSPQAEDSADPVILFNSYCELVSALGMFVLVWIWVVRTGKPRQTGLKPVVATAWTPPHGLLVFIVSTIGFWYTFVAIAGPPPRPSPLIQINSIERKDNTAIVHVTINSQDSATRWRIQWGPSIVYGKYTTFRSVSTGMVDVKTTATLQLTDPDQPIHLRLVAFNQGGYSDTDDVAYRASEGPMTLDADAVGGVATWPGWTVWTRMLLIFLAMVLSARLLPLPHRAWACGVVAAMMVWFDPVCLVNSHVWPQWDVWIVPFIIVAYVLASLELWVGAGLMIGLGCMFKGQMLFAAPILILWPLMGGRIWSALKAAAGLAIGAAMIVWPWIMSMTDPKTGAMIINPKQEIRWLVSSMIAVIVIAAASRLGPIVYRLLRKYWTTRRAIAISVSLVVIGAVNVGYWSWRLAMYLVYHNVPIDTHSSGYLLALLLAIVIVPWFLPARYIGHWLVMMLAATIWIAPQLFHGDFNWKKLGLDYGSVKFEIMAMGNMSYSNLPQMLNLRYRWELNDVLGSLHIAPSLVEMLHRHGMTNVHESTDIVMKTSLAILFFLSLIPSGIAAAVYTRRKDPRALVALAVPWLIFPMVMGQMSERYLIWFSCCSAVFITVSTGLTLLHVLLAILGAGMVGAQLMTQYGDPGRWPLANDFFIKNYPEFAWFMVFLMLVFYVTSLLPSRRAVLGLQR